MKVLHTADWHVGKRLGRIDRHDETVGVLDELVGVAEREQVDLVLVAGDLFDRALPPFASLGLVLDTLVRLAATGAHVVAVAGNHDSAELFSVLAPYLEPRRVTLIHEPLPPEGGGVVTVVSRDGAERAQIACFPFLHETRVIDFMDIPTEEWFKSYAERIRKTTAFYGRAMTQADPGALNMLVGHFMIDGAVPSGSERELHIGEAYMTTAAAVPPEINYTGLGHIHRCQRAPSSSGDAWYSGSLMELDFGEADQDKFVLIVDVTAERTRVEQVPIASGRRLLRVRGTLEDLRARVAEFGDALLDVHVTTQGPEPGLADEVRSFLPNALNVHADYPRSETEATSREGMSLEDLYSAFHRETEGVGPPPELVAAFAELRVEVGIEE